MAKKKKIEKVENEELIELESELKDSEQESKVVEDIKVEDIDPKKQILIEYVDYWKKNNLNGKSRASFNVGKTIWDYWLKYTGRHDRFCGCSSGVVNVVRYLNKECNKYGIEI